MKLGIVVPSNSPISYFTNFNLSLHLLRAGLAAHDVSILMCAQGWKEDELDEAYIEARKNNLDFQAVAVEPESPPRMCYLRQQAAGLLPEADVYMLADDNMRFSTGPTHEIPHNRTSGECYAEVLEYFTRYPRCGVVQCHTSGPDRVIRPTHNGLITTNKGLFLRNIYGGKIWPNFTFGFKSSLEETVAGYLILEAGYFIARQHQNPTIHPIHRIGSDDGLHSSSLIWSNAGAWVRTRYNDPSWDHESGKFPRSDVWELPDPQNESYWLVPNDSH